MTSIESDSAETPELQAMKTKLDQQLERIQNIRKNLVAKGFMSEEADQGEHLELEEEMILKDSSNYKTLFGVEEKLQVKTEETEQIEEEESGAQYKVRIMGFYYSYLIDVQISMNGNKFCYLR